MPPFLAFDMGNVLLPFDHMRACTELGRLANVTPEKVYSIIFTSGLAKRYESGEISTSTFISACRAEICINLSTDQIQKAWSDIFVEDASMTELIASLAENADLCLISNTSELHFQWVSSRFPVIAFFPRLMLSYQVGAMKPAPAIFEAAARYVRPGQLSIYVDDIADFANASEAHGFRGIHFKNHAQLRAQLELLGAL